MNDTMIAQSPVITTDELITALTVQMDALRELACLLFNADHPQKEHLEYRAEYLYEAAACLEFPIEALLEGEGEA